MTKPLTPAELDWAKWVHNEANDGRVDDESVVIALQCLIDALEAAWAENERLRRRNDFHDPTCGIHFCTCGVIPDHA